jgi:hypothetical protein
MGSEGRKATDLALAGQAGRQAGRQAGCESVCSVPTALLHDVACSVAIWFLGVGGEGVGVQMRSCWSHRARGPGAVPRQPPAAAFARAAVPCAGLAPPVACSARALPLHGWHAAENAAFLFSVDSMQV